MVLFNRGASEAEISAKWEALGYPARLPAAVRDLWGKKDMGKFTEKLSVKVGAHEVMMVRVAP